jgi:hypothetical protein
MFLQKVKYFFFLLCLCASSFAQTKVSDKLKKSNLYAGIEVGSKGIKMSIVQMGKNASATGAINVVKDSSINSDFISFTQPSLAATIKGLQALYYSAMLDYGIPSSKIYTVISSGVKGQAEKENKLAHVQKLIDSFKLIINEPKRDFPIIDIMMESRLSHLGIVPEARRYNTFLIDIGSGNTKGGYFKNGNTKELKLFAINWGTRSITYATDYRIEDDISISNFKKQLTRVLAGDPNTDIIYAVNESGAYNMNDNFAFSGGIAWASATLMYPELIDNSVVPLTFNDLVLFNEKLSTNFSAFTPEVISGTTKDKAVSKLNIKTEVKKVLKVFDQKSLIAGTAFLINIIRQFEGSKEKKQFFLVKNGQVGWISAYVNQAVNN